MKKGIVLLLILFILLSASFLKAEEKEEQKKVSTLIILRNEWVEPENSVGYFSHGAFLWWHYDKWLGFGIDLTSKPKVDYTEVNPFISVNKGPWFLVAGVYTNSAGEDYAHAGMWYFNQHGRFEIFADLRNWFDLSGNASHYLDNYLEVTYAIADRISIGPVVTYDYWWGQDHDLMVAGPILYYKLNKSMSLIGRYVHEWDRNAGKVSNTDKFRVGLKICF